MKRRTAFILGFALGYVLGAKAGRKRYEQIRKLARSVASTPPIRRALDEGKDLAGTGAAKARDAVGDQLRDAGVAIRDKVG
jgi:hypothetical protein